MWKFSMDPDSGESAVEVILISKNDANTGLRVFNSIENYKLDIVRAAFTKGRSHYGYLKAFNADLFLSASPEDVKLALQNGNAAATILPGLDLKCDESSEVRLAFDGDAVLFSDEAEIVYQERGLSEFQRNELENSDIPLEPGPFKAFLEAINRIQKLYDKI